MAKPLDCGGLTPPFCLRNHQQSSVDPCKMNTLFAQMQDLLYFETNRSIFYLSANNGCLWVGFLFRASIAPQLRNPGLKVDIPADSHEVACSSKLLLCWLSERWPP